MTVSSHGAAMVNEIAESKRYANAADHASATNEGSFAKSFGRCAYRAVMRAAQSFFEGKKRSATSEVEFASGHHIRTVQMWFADKHQGSATALIALLSTDAAPVVLLAIRAELEAAHRPIPKFYDDLEAFAAVANAMREHEQNKKQASALRKLNDEQ